MTFREDLKKASQELLGVEEAKAEGWIKAHRGTIISYAATALVCFVLGYCAHH